MADPVWLLVMFDLPVQTKEQRRLATAYRKKLLNQGFDMVQLSVYAKYVINQTGVRSILSEVKRTVPKNGAARMLQLTDEQWSSQFRFFGPVEEKPEAKPQVLELFDSW